jgi:alkylated DNA repair dioxygenase AlkB
VTWLPEPAVELVDTVAFAAAVAEALDGGAAIVHGAIPAMCVARLLTEARGHEHRLASKRVGVVEQLVYTRTLTIPTETAPSINALADAIAACARTGWHATEATVSRYPPRGGISPHRDPRRFSGLIVTVTLSGTAEFTVSQDRSSQCVTRRWLVRSGDAVIVVQDPRQQPAPFHAISTGEIERWSITLRQRKPDSDHIAVASAGQPEDT